MISKTVDVNGFIWPASDTECRRVVFSTTRDMEAAIKLAKGRKCAVQAGGNCGVWPAYLAKKFDVVYTFEPDATNYACLVQNVPENVVSANYALSDRVGMVGMVRDMRNIGAHYIDEDGDELATAKIDGLNLDACDYICLDVEGFEMAALRGAVDTIRKFHPVIQCEDKGLSNKYGYEKGAIEKWLAFHFGYKVEARIHRDVILA